MELRHLRYFVAVAEEASFTHAAARLRVAQPALSSQIKDLEDELETQLFERSRSGVLLTRAGKALLLRARSILAQAAEAAQEARTAGGAITGALHLGYPSGLHLSYLAPVIRRFREAHPKVEFDFSHSPAGQQARLLREGRLDLGFVNLPLATEGCAHAVIWRVPFKVVLPARHRLARKSTFDLDDLRGEDFVFCTRESRPEFYDDFFRHCANAGFRPRVVKEVGGYPTNMLGLVAVGVGLSVLPHFANVERIQGILWKPLVRPKWWTDWALIWRAEGVSRVVREFVDLAEKHFGTPAEQERAEI
jgi:DNA-binding transcriptional LysR family regulator